MGCSSTHLHQKPTKKPHMKPRKSRLNPALSLAVTSFVMVFSSTLQADLVATWKGETFQNGSPWVSSPGNVSATPTGAPERLENAMNSKAAVNLNGSSYFVIPQASNPLNDATAFTLVAAFIPMSPGNSGDGFYQASGLIGMEQAGDVPDWGLGWNGNRVNGGVGGPDIPVFSAFKNTNELLIVAYTWSNNGTQRLFVNGREVAKNTASSTTKRNAGDFALGAMTPTGNNPIIGEIAELRMYNSDETGNIATISDQLRIAYADDFLLQFAGLLTPSTGEIRFQNSSATKADLGGTFELLINGATVPSQDLQITQQGDTIIVKFTENALPPATNATYDLTVPVIGGPNEYIFGSFDTAKVPADLAGIAGTVGTWGIREYPIPAGDILAAGLIAMEATQAFVEDSAPVFNHSDPFTNTLRTSGNFNNDFPIISDTEFDDQFVVVGKTKITVPSAGVYTFSVHSDDGFGMRITGPSGGRFIGTGGDGIVDPADPQSIVRDGGTGDSNTRGFYQFDAAGTYDILYLGWDGGSGAYYEVAWAPGTFQQDRDTNTWSLVGTPSDPSIPAFRERYPSVLPGPSGGAGTFGVRTFLQAKNGEALVANLEQASTFVTNTLRVPSDPNNLTVDAQLPYLNHADPQSRGGDGILPSWGYSNFPGNTPNDDDNVVTVAKGYISIATAGTYTFGTAMDDGFMLRLKGTAGLADPSFKRATGNGRFEMSNPNEIFVDDGASTTRGIIDLQAGIYAVEMLQQENVGGFHYQLVSAPGEWPGNTVPPDGFKLVGFQSVLAAIPGIAEPGWKVESSLPGTPNDAFGFSIAGAEARINATLAMNPQPANAVSYWDTLNFNDPETGPEGSFTPSNPWPLNTPQPDDNYAMRATGTLNITVPGVYHLGFQGDDGGYMFIYGLGGLADPVISSIVYTNVPAAAAIGTATGSTVNNAIRAELGTGNSRTVVSVPLAVGQYKIQTLFYEGGGGSFWEVFGGQAIAPGYNYPLLAKGAGTNVSIGAGLPVVQEGATVPTEIRISGFTVTGSPVGSASFSINSVAGESYVVQASTDLVSWVDIKTVPSGGTVTNVNITMADHPQFNGKPKVFFRVVDLP